MPRPIRPPAPLIAMPTYALSLLGREAHDRMAAWLPAGLRLGHLAVLGALAEVAPRAQRELSELLGIHASDMVALVEDLEQRELISRSADPVDRRRNLVRLTPAGRKLVRQATAYSRRVHRELLAELSTEERDVVRDLMDRALAAGARSGAS
jgi:MarR family transcriptional regulator, lower aerobic nicotinate degradation pathway regulator